MTDKAILDYSLVYKVCYKTEKDSCKKYACIPTNGMYNYDMIMFELKKRGECPSFNIPISSTYKTAKK